MTPERAKELLPIITAYAEGKTVQYRPAPNCPWKIAGDTPGLTFEDGRGEYRIKPDTAKYRRYLYKGYVCTRVGLTSFSTEPGLIRNIETSDTFIRWIDTDWQEVEV